MDDGQNNKKATPNVHLRATRERRGWSQRDLANELGISELTVGRWERGERAPQLIYRAKLAELFGMTVEELGLVPQNRTQDIPLSTDEKAGEAHDEIQSTALPKAQTKLPFISTLRRVWHSFTLLFHRYTYRVLAIILLITVLLGSAGLFLKEHIVPSHTSPLPRVAFDAKVHTSLGDTSPLPGAAFQVPTGWKSLIDDPMNTPYTWSDNLPGCIFKNGIYHLILNDQEYCTNDVSAANLNIYPLHTYTYQIKTKLLKGLQSGIMFCQMPFSLYIPRKTPVPPYRSFDITADGHYDLFFDNGNGDRELATGMSSYIIQGYNHFNILAVTVNNGNIDMYINNHFVQRYHDLTACDGGVVGVEATSYPLQTHMQPMEAIYRDMMMWGPQ